MSKSAFRPALLESECLNVRNSTTSAILRCSVTFCAMHDQLTSRHAQLMRCFSAVAELLVLVYQYHKQSITDKRAFIFVSNFYFVVSPVFEKSQTKSLGQCVSTRHNN